MVGRPKGKPYRRKVTQLTREGLEVKTYNSIKEAAEEHFISPVAISRALTGMRKSAAGYLWIYAE